MRWEQADLIARLRAAMPGSVDAPLDDLGRYRDAEDGARAPLRWITPALPRCRRRSDGGLSRPERSGATLGAHALSCRECKPDGCLSTDGVGALLEALRHDSAVPIRRYAAGR